MAHVLWLSQENLVLALDPEAYCSYSSTSVHTNCRQDAVHNMHMNTDINTYTFSLNALLCPRHSDFEMKRCINKTAASCENARLMPLRWPDINMRVRGHLATFLCASAFLKSLKQLFFFSLLPSGSDLAVRVSFFCPSQMGAVLHFKPVAFWESSTALPVGILVGYLRERVRSDQVPTHGPKNYGQHLSFCSYVEFTSSSVTVSSMHLHNIVQVQSGIGRRVDKDVWQPVPLVRHPI